MATDSFEITYAAHTASCSFLLDAEGVCRRIVMVPGASKRRDPSRTASRCVGAQYVASLDAGVPGCLVELPRIGSAMLFARVDERGRISLVRTGVVTRFEALRGEDPFADPAPSDAMVATSAPSLTPRTPKKAKSRSPADIYSDPAERTQPIHALRAEDLLANSVESSAPELATSEYRSSAPPPLPRSTWPSPGQAPQPQPRTLRAPNVEIPVPDDSDPYAARPVPPRTDPYMSKVDGRTPRASEPVPTPRWRPDPAMLGRRGGR